MEIASQKLLYVVRTIYKSPFCFWGQILFVCPHFTENLEKIVTLKTKSVLLTKVAAKEPLW